MKIRIKFAKYGSMKFIGHLDVMRFFQKAMRRADVDICYTGGFSPHQVMSFAAPLGLGATSEAEYMDIEVHSIKTSDEMVERMNRAMVEGMRVLSCRRLPDNAKNAMSIVAAADYSLFFRKGYEPADRKEFQNKLEVFLKQDEILIQKKTKKTEKEVDIRPMIKDVSIKEDKIELKLAAGSSENLKPELIMQAFYEAQGMEWNPFIFQIHRSEIYGYADQGGSEGAAFVSLEDLGEEIE